MQGEKYTFNIYAFFFGIFWFMYRKMYVQALIIMLLLFTEGFIEGALTNNLDSNISKLIGYLSTGIIAAVIGTVANNLYFRKAERVISEESQQEPDRAKLITRLQKRGGVSYWFLVLVAVCLFSIIAYFYTVNNTEATSL